MRRFVAVILGILMSHSVIAQSIQLTVTYQEKAVGEVFVALFDSADAFPGGEPLIGIRKIWEGPTMQFRLEDIAPGTYAVATYLDTDESESLTRNFFGIPTEPVGFSGDPGFGKPDFSDVSFEKGADTKSVRVILQD